MKEARSLLFFIPENLPLKKTKKKGQKSRKLLPRKTDPKVTPEKIQTLKYFDMPSNFERFFF